MSNEEKLVKSLLLTGFRLGGSRRMNQINPEVVPIKDDTDWDLYAQDTQRNHLILRSYGFQLQPAPRRNYWDNLLSEMYKHPDYNIEVLLRTDMEHYTYCFDSIDPQYFRDHLWKSAPGRSSLLSETENFRAKVQRYFNQIFRDRYKDYSNRKEEL